MKKRIIVLSFILTFAILLSACGNKSAQDKFWGTEGEPVVAVVEDTEIAADFLSAYTVLLGLNRGYDMTLEAMKSQTELVKILEESALHELADYILLEKYYNDKGEDVYGDNYNMKLSAFIGAVRKQAEGDEELNRILTDGNITDKVLTRYYIDSLISNKLYDEVLPDIDDDRIEARYAEQAAMGENSMYVATEPMVSAAHILAESEEKCREAYDKVMGGVDFATAASEYGTDATKDRGGELGPFVYAGMVAEFSEVVFSLEPGTVSEPFETQYGWHIAKVDERIETSELIPLDWVRESIRQELMSAEYDERLEEYTKDYTVEFFYPKEVESEGEGDAAAESSSE